MLLRPLYIEKLASFFNTPVVKVITGIRRSGKTTLLSQLTDRCKSEGAKDKIVVI
jgi:hypothetical protein